MVFSLHHGYHFRLLPIKRLCSNFNVPTSPLGDIPLLQLWRHSKKTSSLVNINSFFADRWGTFRVGTPLLSYATHCKHRKKHVVHVFMSDVIIIVALLGLTCLCLFFFNIQNSILTFFFKNKLPVWWYDTENNLTHFVKKFKFIIKITILQLNTWYFPSKRNYNRSFR